MQQHKATINRLGLLLVFTLTAVDSISALFRPLGWTGLTIWYDAFLLILLYACWCFFQIILHTIRHKTILALAGISIVIGVCIFNLTGVKSLSGETTQEIACALNHLQKSTDYGFQQTCFFGYPARQYSIPSIPTLLLGRSQLALNLGGMIYFTLGIIIFSHGILLVISDPKKADILTIIALASLFHFHYVIHFLFLYEQSIFPLSFALIGCGIVMHYLERKDWYLLALLSIVCIFCIFSYTPSLSLVPLGCAFLLYTAYSEKNRMAAVTIRAIVCCIGLEFLLSLIFRKDIHLFQNYPGSYVAALLDCLKGIGHLFSHTLPSPYTSPIFTGVLLGLLITLCIAKNTWPRLIFLWIIAVFIASITSKGYTFYSIEFRLHRFMVILPVLFATILYTCRHQIGLTKNATLLMVAGILVSSGIVYTILFQQQRPENIQLAFAQWLPAKTHFKTDQSLTLLYDSHMHYNLSSLNDTMQYFYPDMKLKIDYDKSLSQDNCSISIRNSALLIPMSHPCAIAQSQKPDIFSYKQGPGLGLFQ